MFNDCKQIMTVREMENRKNWLRVRAQGIGGSDAGAIMGLNKYKGPMAVYLEKTGQVEPEDISKKPAVIAGQMLEPVVARIFAEVTGKKVRRMGTLQSLANPWMHANPDRVIIGENAGLEIKTGGAWSKGLWEDDNIPDSYYLQCLHYMAVTGADRWYIAAWLGGQDFVTRTIDRREDEIHELIKEEKQFWARVQNRQPPEVDGSFSCGEGLKQLYKDEFHDSEIEFSEEIGQLFDEYDNIQKLIKADKAHEQEIKNQFMATLQNNQVGWFGNRRVTWKAPKPSEGIRLSEIKKEAPDLYAALKKRGLVHERVSERRLRIY